MPDVQISKQEARRTYIREYMRERRRTDPAFAELQRKRTRDYARRNRAATLQKTREFRANNKEYIRAYNKQYLEEHREAIRTRRRRTGSYIGPNKRWKKENAVHVTQYNRSYRAKRYREDMGFRLAVLERSRIYGALRGKRKMASTTRLLGCSFAHLKEQLESQFRDGMSWENIGQWHVDHKRPLCSFDLSSEEDQLIAFNHKNLQPLWGPDNLKKGGKWILDS